jgi:hypothetical protein
MLFLQELKNGRPKIWGVIKMRKMTSWRVFLYSGLVLFFAVSVILRIQQINKERKQDVVSVIAEWEKFGRPVYVLKMKKSNFDDSIRLSALWSGENALNASVSWDTALRLRAGQSFIAIMQNEGEAIEVSGVVSSVGGRDSETGLSTIQMRLNSGKDLAKVKKSKESLGTIIPMDIKVSTSTNVYKVPVEALVKDKGKSYLWLMTKESLAHRVEVVLGDRDASEIIITQGLSEGDEVIIAGKSNLSEGIKVGVSTETENKAKENERGNK